VVNFTPQTIYPGERARGIHLIGGWVDPKAVLDAVGQTKYLAAAGNRTSIFQLVDIATELLRFM
jgi:hypothetical protein